MGSIPAPRCRSPTTHPSNYVSTALWATDPTIDAISVRGKPTVNGTTHSEGGISIRGGGSLLGGTEYATAIDVRGSVTIEPAAQQVAAGVVPQQLATIEQHRPATDTADSAPNDACDGGEWKPEPEDLVVDVILVPCDVEIRTSSFDSPITTTIIAEGHIRVQGSNVEFVTGDRPSLVAIGDDASIELRGSNITLQSVFSDSDVTVQGSRIDFNDPDQPAIVATGSHSNIDLRGSNVTMSGGLLSNGAVSLRGSRTTASCGIYASTIDVRGANSSFSACDQL